MAHPAGSSAGCPRLVSSVRHKARRRALIRRGVACGARARHLATCLPVTEAGPEALYLGGRSPASPTTGQRGGPSPSLPSPTVRRGPGGEGTPSHGYSHPKPPADAAPGDSHVPANRLHHPRPGTQHPWFWPFEPNVATTPSESAAISSWLCAKMRLTGTTKITHCATFATICATMQLWHPTPGSCLLRHGSGSPRAPTSVRVMCQRPRLLVSSSVPRKAPLVGWQSMCASGSSIKISIWPSGVARQTREGS
jgi:hypothetical protein